MQFSEAVMLEGPGFAIFTAALNTVFDADDGMTEHIERLTAEARLVYLVWCFDGEIHNGGFDQFFHNAPGGYATELLTQLATLGAGISHDLLTRAMALFPEAAPARDRAVRVKQLERLAQPQSPDARQPWAALDQQFWKYED